MSDTPFYGSDYAALDAFDPDIAGVLLSELGRIRSGLQLIASENLSSPAVLTALGSTLSNKYAEGYPGRRYYGGCAEVDKAEQIAICLLYTSDAADERSSVDLGGRRIIKKNNHVREHRPHTHTQHQTSSNICSNNSNEQHTRT